MNILSVWTLAISIITCLVTLAGIVFVSGRLAQRVDDHARTLDEHGNILTVHGDKLNEHSTSIGHLQGWKAGFDAAISLRQDRG